MFVSSCRNTFRNAIIQSSCQRMLDNLAYPIKCRYLLSTDTIQNFNLKCETYHMGKCPDEFTLRKRFMSSSSGVSCWDCGKSNDINAMFCVHCNTLQKPNSNLTFFELIGVPKSFDVDESDVAKKYKNLQKLLHPDKFSNKKSSEQEISEEYSSLVNKAYTTLLHPLSRGTYMLNLKGLELPEKTDLESKFLHEIMERNEEVEDADTPEAILKINKENKELIAMTVAQLSKAFMADDMEGVVKVLIRIKYYASIETQIKSIIRKMGIVE